jgi:hypothetical protein
MTAVVIKKVGKWEASAILSEEGVWLSWATASDGEEFEGEIFPAAMEALAHAVEWIETGKGA